MKEFLKKIKTKFTTWLNKGEKESILIKHTLILVLTIMLNTVIFIKHIPVLILSSMVIFSIFYWYILKKIK
tara:strand:+ start:2914 stop:3126 length:213 start_codon:yes stop_codon:yes gene_type:complete